MCKVAVRQYRQRIPPERYFRDGKLYFALGRGAAKTTTRLVCLIVGLLLTYCLLLVGRRVSWQFRRRVCSWGQLGLLRLGMECYLAAPEPRSDGLACLTPESGYARDQPAC